MRFGKSQRRSCQSLPLLETVKSALADSPLPLERYMALCNTHYYATRDPLGAPKEIGGDFTTAPEISQLFGELLGLWAVAEWERLGKPAPFMLLELGPGRGTLMQDALRAARVRPAFLQAMQLHLCETSPTLRHAQSDLLDDYSPIWHADLSNLGSLPVIVIANEFFDALPVRQVIRTAHGNMKGWLQRHLHLENSTPAWIDLPVAPADIPADLHLVSADTIIEYSPAARQIMQQLCHHIHTHGGSAAIIDYGDCVKPALLANGNTLQAMHRHQTANPLKDAGNYDLTCHVDFAPLLAVARAQNLQASFGTQAAFLDMLGIRQRVSQLTAAHLERADTLATEYSRLTAEHQMGTLFKALTLSSR